MAGRVKAKIVEAAWELFHEKGYDNTTIDDIIKRSGTSKVPFIIILTARMHFSELCLRFLMRNIWNSLRRLRMI